MKPVILTFLSALCLALSVSAQSQDKLGQVYSILKKQSVRPGNRNSTGTPASTSTLSSATDFPSYSSGKLLCQVLYIFDPGEVIYNNEYFSGLRKNGYDFAMQTYDRNKDLYYAVLNGKKHSSSTNDHLPWRKTSFNNNKCLIYIGQNREKYLLHDGQMIGPFADLEYFTPHAWDKSLYAFLYRNNGNYYYRDFNGSVYRISDNKIRTDNENLKFRSPNGNYVLEFIDLAGVHKMKINGKKISLPHEITSETYLAIHVSNKGEVLFDRGSDYCSYKYDPTVNNFSRENDESHYGSQDYDSQYYDRYRHDGNMHDTSGKHELWYNWNYDYVVIDDEKYGESAPLDAWYDADKDAFVWIGIEGQKLLRYTFKL